MRNSLFIGVVTFLLSALAIYVVSRLTPAPDKAVQAEFDRVNVM